MRTPVIYPISLGFINVFIVRGDGVVLVDAGMKGGPRKILAKLKRIGISPQEVKLIVVTHAHGDHTTGLATLQQATGAPVAVHRSEADCLRKGLSAPAMMRSRMMKLMSGLMGMGKIGTVEPGVLVGDRLELADYGIDGYLLHTPGHSDGSITLITSAGDALTGDMIGARRGKQPGIPGVYNDLAELKNSIKVVLATGARHLFTSHGGVYTEDQVQKLVKQ